MNRKAMYFLKKQEILIMVVKYLFIIIVSLLITQKSLTNILYNDNNIIITDIDVQIYKNLYSENYNSNINNNAALKDLVLIKNLLNDLEKNNKEFINKIDNEISLEFGYQSLNNKNLRDFLRFYKIRNEFIINYFKNKLDITEIKTIFKNIEDLNLPISDNDCLIINKVVNLQYNDEFIERFFYILKNGPQKIIVKVEDIKYQVCIDQEKFKFIESHIVNYIRAQTDEEFTKFVYDKANY